MHASYKEAIAWIAKEDEPTYLYPEEIINESGMTVSLIADLWRKEPELVASDVSKVRIRTVARQTR